MEALPCTREDVARIISDGLGQLQVKIDRIESAIQRMAVANSSSSQSRTGVQDVMEEYGEDARAKLPTVHYSMETSAVSMDASIDQGLNSVSLERSKSSTKSGSNMWAVKGGPRSTVAEAVNRIEDGQAVAVLGASTKRSRFYITVLPFLRGIARWWDKLEEPPRSGWSYGFLKSSAFSCICSIVIMVNSFSVAYAADYEMKHIDNEGASMRDFMRDVDHAFLIFYTLELLLRLMVHRLYFFVNHDLTWNWMDFFLVVISVFDALSSLLLSSTGDNNVGFMRIMRIGKVAKVFRVFRAMRFFSELAIMIDSFVKTLVALFWSFLMIMLVLYIFAVLFLQAMANYMSNESHRNDPSFNHQIRSKFGSFDLTLFSLYAAVTGGLDWAEDFHLIKRVGAQYAIMYLVFVFFFLLSVFNILTGMFVEKATIAASPDRDELILAKKRRAREEAKEFRHLCSMLDEGGSGTICWTDFEKHMENDVMVAYMEVVGLHVYEVELFFHLLAGDNDHKEISIDRFVEGCMQMKGGATGIDMQRQFFELNALKSDLSRFANTTQNALQQCLTNIHHIESIVASMEPADYAHSRIVTGL